MIFSSSSFHPNLKKVVIKFCQRTSAVILFYNFGCSCWYQNAFERHRSSFDVGTLFSWSVVSYQNNTLVIGTSRTCFSVLSCSTHLLYFPRWRRKDAPPREGRPGPKPKSAVSKVTVSTPCLNASALCRNNLLKEQ